jgi:protein-disulfide isomerase
MSMIRILLVVVLVAASMLLSFHPGSAQSSDELRSLRKEIEAIKEGQNKLQKDVQDIKALLQGGRAGTPSTPSQPVSMVLTLDGDPVKGDRNASVVLVEFTDYQCPFCARHARDTMPQIEAEYVKTGKVRYVTREFPLESIHPQAFKAAEAALCAGDQGKYWEMHARLFANQRALAPGQLASHAQAVGLDEGKFTQCLEGGTKSAKVRKDLADGAKAGVTGTPAFFIGVTDGANVKGRGRSRERIPSRASRKRSTASSPHRTPPPRRSSRTWSQDDASLLNTGSRLTQGDFSNPSGISSATTSNVTPKNSMEGTGRRR